MANLNNTDLPSNFINQSVFRLNESLERIEKCVSFLNEKEVWYKPNQTANSVGILIQHLCGNITQYILSGLGNKPDQRKRDDEFLNKKLPKITLIKSIHTVIHEACDIINDLNENQLKEVRTIQGFSLSGIGIVIHVVEHLSYHTGQIALLTKLITNKDLGFYSGADLNTKNE